MYLKKTEFWKKGLPYVGNKNRKAQQIIDALPKAKRLVDVFGGSGAISLAAAASNRWETVIYNDKRTTVVNLLSALMENNKRIDLDLYTHITRKQFLDWRDNQPDSIERTLVLLCWSFSNSEKSYLWGKDKEQARLDLIQKYIVDGDHNLSIQDRHQKYLDSKNPIKLPPIERIKRLELMQTTQVSLPIIYLNMDYSEILISENDVIYCDPPYINTPYRYGDFDDNRFYEWLNNLPTNNIFISERYILPHTEVFKDLGIKESFTNVRNTNHELLLKYKKY